MFDHASDVADLARVVPAVPSVDAIYREDAGKRRIVAYLYVGVRLDVGNADGFDGLNFRLRFWLNLRCLNSYHRGSRCTTVTCSDLNRFAVHQPRDVERLVTLARGTH